MPLERFGKRASIDKPKPVADEFAEFVPDLLIHPKTGGRHTAFLASSVCVHFQEVELL